MLQRNSLRVTKFMVLFLLVLAIPFLAACSGGTQILVAELNRDFEAEIFLATLGDEEGDWQSLAEDVASTRLFNGRYATFVPGTDRLLLWYEDGNDRRVEQMRIGDDAPTEVFEGDSDDSLFGSFSEDPFIIYLTETEDFSEFSCYVSVDGAEAERLTRGSLCVASENGVIMQERDADEVTLMLVSLDGEDETVILDGAEDILDTSWNRDFSMFAYVELGRRDAQVYLIEPGDEEGEPLGDEFEIILRANFLPDGETVYVIGKPDEDDDEVGLYINGTGDPLLEEENISYAGQSEDGEFVLFGTMNTREEVAYVYSLDDETVTEVADGDAITFLGFVTDERLLLQVTDNDETTFLSANTDGSEVIELFSDDAFDVTATQIDRENGRFYATLRDSDGLTSLYTSGLDAEDGFFLIEEWATIELLNATSDEAIFMGQEDIGDDRILYTIPLEEDAAEVELDDDAENSFENVFLADNGRSLIYTVWSDGFSDAEVRQVPLDGSERPETLYRDVFLIDVNWEGASNLGPTR